MSFEDLCNTGLTLGRVPDQYFPLDHQQKKKPPSKSSHFPPPDLTLALSSDQVTLDARNKMHSEYSKSAMLHRQASSISGMSSFSNSSVKRERDASSEEVEVERTLPPKVACDDHDEEEGGTRKKLRLTKEQALVLEDSFKEHSTLNPNQKQALAKRLNLRPRQVEVWFQNRRARTKLKQTEVDCELLKKCYDNLTDENRRLNKELKELKALKPTAPPPFYMQFPAATLAVCPSCERIGASVSHDNSSKPQFYGPFNSHPSAAC